MRKKLIILFLFAFSGLSGQNYEVGAFAGFSLYEGDISPDNIDGYLRNLNTSYGFFARGNVIDNLSFRLNYAQLTLSAADSLNNEKRIPRDLSFRSTIHEISLLGEWNLVRWYPYGGSFYVMPYLMGGLSIFHMNPETFYEDRWVALQPLGTEAQGLPGKPAKYDNWQWSLPIGGGLKFYISERIVIGVELSGRYAITSDYLDDVGSETVVYQEILAGNGELAAKLSRPSFNPDTDDPLQPYRRGGSFNDFYFTGGFTISYVFGNSFFFGDIRSIKCPTFSVY